MSKELILVSMRNEPRNEIQKDAGLARLMFAARKNDLEKGPSFSDVLGPIERNPGERIEKKAQNLNQEKETVVAAAQAKSESAKSEKVEMQTQQTQLAKDIKPALVKQVVALLKPSIVKAQEQKAAGTVKNELLTALSKKGTDELRDLLEKIKSGTCGSQDLLVRNILIPGGNARLQTEKIRAGLDHKSIASAIPAFKAVVDHDGLKIQVNKNKVDVMDKRTAVNGQNSHAQTLAHRSAHDSGNGSNGKGGPNIGANNGSGNPVSGNAAGASQTGSTGFDQMLSQAPVNGTSHKTVAPDRRLDTMPSLNETNRIFNDIVRHARMMLEDRKSTMQIDLKPEHLGRVLLKIEVTDNKIVSAQIFTQNENTGDMLKQHMSQIAEAFQQSGLNLRNLDVNAGGAGDGFFKDQKTGLEKVVSHIRKNDDVQGSGVAYLQYGNVIRQAVDAIV